MKGKRTSRVESSNAVACGGSATRPESASTSTADAARPDAGALRRLADQFQVDPRSILAVVDGRPVRGMAGERARSAAEAWRSRCTSSSRAA
jgi:hypothetical protein